MPRQPKTGPLPNAPPRPIVMPAWARTVAATHPEFEYILACASVEWHLVFEGPEAVVFHDLARAAKREWTRLGKTSDDALLVAYELLRLAPGISECLERTEYAWLGAPAAAIEARRGEFERRVRKKAGAPRHNEYLRAMFEILRTAGHSYEKSVREIAAAQKWHCLPETERNALDSAAAARAFRRAQDAVRAHDVERVKRAVRPSRSHRPKT